ncbi:MAG: VOC family protein [Pseudomonadota bacterium]
MQQIFVNLPVTDLEKSKAFYTALGFTINEQFTNEQGACVVISDTIFVMLLTKDFFATFTDKNLCDARAQTEVLLCLSCTSRVEADNMVSRAVKAGGTAPRPSKDHGFMYQQGFEDLDGHIWELVSMNPDFVPQT